ncbi:hypothetical protein [Mycobacterium palustre]|uniref:hypothetical protein n=1 Tax=Mycobacterium palustre TaxID=153971 RepID=UPI0011503BC0|nr:hypothetical protein [Mycobacterium palustre]MCV7100733.1 hypothetical protein [Mycobacterium palustre]
MAVFSAEVMRLHNRGFTAGYIASQLGLTAECVRAVVSAELTGCEVKPVYAETTAPVTPKPKLTREQRLQAAKRAKAEKKRQEALRLLAEAESVLKG